MRGEADGKLNRLGRVGMRAAIFSRLFAKKLSKEDVIVI
jgi:hypothetical protein